ncbi:MAG: hypothetical protein GX375_04870 [Clostridiales bacterium]|nr:hypothetical protein [Clostridiales bacterium]
MFYNDRKKKTLLAIVVLITMMTSGYLAGTWIGRRRLDGDQKQKNEESGYETMQLAERINKEIASQEIARAELTTQDTLFVFQKNYSLCKDTRVEERKAKDDEVGLSRQSIELKFPEWGIYEFSTEKVTLTKEIDDYCPGHFVLKEKEGMVVIYMPSEPGYEYTSIEETHIPINKLPPDVQEEIRGGMVIDSLEEVEYFMENLES